MRELLNPRFPLIISDKLYKRKKRLNHLIPEREGAWAVFRFIHEYFPEVFNYNSLPTKKEAYEYLNYRFDFDPQIKKIKDEELYRLFSAIVGYDSIAKEDYRISYVLFYLFKNRKT